MWDEGNFASSRHLRHGDGFSPTYSIHETEQVDVVCITPFECRSHVNKESGLDCQIDSLGLSYELYPVASLRRTKALSSTSIE